MHAFKLTNLMNVSYIWGGLQDPAIVVRNTQEKRRGCWRHICRNTHGSHTSKGYESNQQSWSMPASKSLEGDEDPLSCKAHHHLADQGGPCINISPRKTAKQKSLDINCCWKHLGKGPSGRQHNSRR